MPHEKLRGIDFEHGGSAAYHLTYWLVDSGKKSDCKRFLPYAKVAERARVRAA